MTTRREFTQGSLAAFLMLLFTTLNRPEDVDATPSQPFDESRFETMVIVTMLTAGITPGHEGSDVMLRHLMWGEPLPDDQEPARHQVRDVLYTMLARLG